MAIKQHIDPSSEQDKLKEGLLKTIDGNYVIIERYGKKLDEQWEQFSPVSKQDKLADDLIKIFRTGDYLSIRNLGEIERSDCFVATVVYGRRDAPQVKTLREFRDNVLMQSQICRAFVNFYYSGAGKRTAEFIRDHLPSSIPYIRKGLDVLVERYSAQRK